MKQSPLGICQAMPAPMHHCPHKAAPADTAHFSRTLQTDASCFLLSRKQLFSTPCPITGPSYPPAWRAHVPSSSEALQWAFPSTSDDPMLPLRALSSDCTPWALGTPHEAQPHPGVDRRDGEPNFLFANLEMQRKEVSSSEKLERQILIVVWKNRQCCFTEI